MVAESTNKEMEAARKDAVKAAKEEEKAAKMPEREEAPYDALFHPDGEPRMMKIAREGGAGERYITAEEWERNPAYHMAGPGGWRIIESEVVAPHHSDGIY